VGLGPAGVERERALVMSLCSIQAAEQLQCIAQIGVRGGAFVATRERTLVMADGFTRAPQHLQAIGELGVCLGRTRVDGEGGRVAFDGGLKAAEASKVHAQQRPRLGRSLTSACFQGNMR
jgi:hypothetical protein